MLEFRVSLYFLFFQNAYLGIAVLGNGLQGIDCAAITPLFRQHPAKSLRLRLLGVAFFALSGSRGRERENGKNDA